MAQAAPRLGSKDLLLLLVLRNALEHALAADVQVLADGTVGDLAVLVALDGGGREQNLEVAVNLVCRQRLLAAVLVDDDDVSQALVGSAQLGGDIGACGALLAGEVRALANELVDARVMLEGLLLPGQAGKVVILEGLRGSGVAMGSLCGKERLYLVLDLGVVDAEGVVSTAVAGAPWALSISPTVR